MLFQTIPGSSTLQNGSCMTTYFPCHKLSKWDKQDTTGHCLRSTDKFISNVLLQWTPIHGHTGVGWPAKTYIHQLCVDTGCRLEDLAVVMTDKDE